MSQAQRPLQFAQVITGLVILILAWPITVTCSSPLQTCTPPPNEKGEIVRPVTIEPNLIVILEKLLKTDIAIAYKTGTAIDRPVKVLAPTNSATDTTEQNQETDTDEFSSPSSEQSE